MRGRVKAQRGMLAFVDPESYVPAHHPLRRIKPLADAALAALSDELDAAYAADGRPSIPPERLLKASLLMALFTIRSERELCQHVRYNLLYRWFLDMDLYAPPWNHSTFSKNRTRFLGLAVGQLLFDTVVAQARNRGLLSREHFTIDGTLIEANASLKSFRPRDAGPPPEPPDDPGNPTVDFHGERRANATHQSTTDPEARLARKGKGKEAKLAFAGHALMENRHGLLADFQVTAATGTAERDAVPELIDGAIARGFQPRTVGADKAYDTADCVADLRERGVTPHVAQNTARRGGSAIDGRTTRHPGYAISQRLRKRIEEIFGWMKTIGGLRRTRWRGVERTGLLGYLVGTAYNLLRVSRLLARAEALAVAS